MNKLYYKNSYIKEFYADIVEKTIIDNKTCIILSKTAFFPGGGGQFFDIGFIEDIRVIETFEKDKKIYHKLDKNLDKDKNLYCKINFENRFDGMVQHLAQHVLSGCFFKKFHKNTVGFHLGQEVSTIDIKGDVNHEELLEIEKMANDMISKNLEVIIHTPNENELQNFNLRRDLPNTDEEIRVVEIKDLDINACCGVHPKSTLELKLIKLRKSEKNRGATRIEYLAGNRAVNYVLNRDLYLNNICQTLKCTDKEAVNFIEGNFKKIEDLNFKIKKLEENLIDYEIETLINNCKIFNDKKLIIKEYFDKDINFVKKISQKITENEDFLFIAIIKNEKNNLIVASSKNTDFDSNNILKNILDKVDGRGGGNKNLAQGFFEKDLKITKDNIL